MIRVAISESGSRSIPFARIGPGENASSVSSAPSVQVGYGHRVHGGNSKIAGDAYDFPPPQLECGTPKLSKSPQTAHMLSPPCYPNQSESPISSVSVPVLRNTLRSILTVQECIEVFSHLLRPTRELARLTGWWFSIPSGVEGVHS